MGRSLRAITRETVRERIATEALQLFDEHGFDETTVDDIAAAVGISPRSFFRYFPSKEHVVIGDAMFAGELVADAVTERIGSEPAWQVLQGAFRGVAERMEADAARWLRVMRVITNAETLRARNLEKHLAWSARIVPLIEESITPDAKRGDLPARSLVGAAFACLDAALASWTETDGTVSCVAALDRAFDAVRAEICAAG